MCNRRESVKIKASHGKLKENGSKRKKLRDPKRSKDRVNEKNTQKKDKKRGMK